MFRLQCLRFDFPHKKIVNYKATASPSITLLLPNFGPNHGVYKVAVFGLNFVPSVNFQLKFGNIVRYKKFLSKIIYFSSTEVEFHCSTALIATIDCTQGEILSGEGFSHL